MESGFDFHIVFHSIPFLAKGMWLTLVLTFLGICGGLLLRSLDGWEGRSARWWRCSLCP